jgi:hypothetical protein
MPNWTSNRIHVEGDAADIRAFLETVKWEDRLFDFDRIIPRPEILNHTGSGHREIDGQKVESWYIVKHAKHDPPQEQEIVRLFTAEEEAELNAIGHHDWYSWSVQKWGTKWNASRVEIDDSSIKYGFIEILFETAWDAPVPVLRRIVEMFPKLSFDCRWRHEDENPYLHSLDDEPDPCPALTFIAQAVGGAA